MKATKEDKVKRKHEASFKRKGKRIAKDKHYFNTARNYDISSISWGRRRCHGSAFICEMYYSGCTLRGFCEGDC